MAERRDSCYVPALRKGDKETGRGAIAENRNMSLKVRVLHTAVLLIVGCICLPLVGQENPPPPPAAPVIGKKASTSPDSESVAAATTTGPYLFSIGDPSDDEQMYLELLNRARAHPP